MYAEYDSQSRQETPRPKHHESWLLKTKLRSQEVGKHRNTTTLPLHALLNSNLGGKNIPIENQEMVWRCFLLASHAVACAHLHASG